MCLGGQNNPAAEETAMEGGKGENEGEGAELPSMLETDDREATMGSQADLEDFGNFQDSENFDEFGDFGEFEGAEEPQTVESGLPVDASENGHLPQPQQPDSFTAQPSLTGRDPLLMSPETFHQYLEQALSFFRPDEGEIEMFEMFEASHEQWTLDRKGGVVNDQVNNRTLHLNKIEGAADEIGRLALERVLKRLVSGQGMLLLVTLSGPRLFLKI